MEKLSRKLQQLGWYPFETVSSSNAFLWSVVVNFALVAVILLWTHFCNRGLRGDLIGIEIAASQVFGLTMSIVNLVKYKRFEKKYNEKPSDEITKEDIEEREERNSAVGFLWYWICGTVLAYIAVAPVFSLCKLLF